MSAYRRILCPLCLPDKRGRCTCRLHLGADRRVRSRKAART